VQLFLHLWQPGHRQIIHAAAKHDNTPLQRCTTILVGDTTKGIAKCSLKLLGVLDMVCFGISKTMDLILQAVGMIPEQTATQVRITLVWNEGQNIITE
jgi:hypothetical protein